MHISSSEITVRYSETDMMGIVHHSRYFPWFEIGRADYFSASGTSYKEAEESGVLLPLIEAGCNYRQGARYLDKLTVKTFVGSLTPAKVRFDYEIWRGGDKIATGHTVHAFTNRALRAQNLKKAAPVLWEKLSALAGAGS